MRRLLAASVVIALLQVTLGCGWWETVGHRKIDLAFNRAVAEGDLQEAKRLLDQGADVNTRFTRSGGYTTLAMVAGTRGYAEGLRFLLENGADPDVPTNRGETALTIAVSQGKADYVALLLEHGADAAIARPDGTAALSIAEEQGSVEIVRLLEAALSGEVPAGVP